jgi:polyisoprenoid-binding protein YceI
MKLSTTTFALILTSTIAITAPNAVINPPKKSNPIKSTVKAQSFKVDNQASKIGWLAKKATGEHNGNINITNGNLQIQNNVLTAVSLDIDTRTITDIDLTEKADNDKLISTLKSETFFNADKFPKASLLTTSIVHNSGQQYTVTGKLTIKGITNDVTFPATVSVNGKKLTANAKITIDRTKYDIKFRSKSFFENLGDKVIYDNFDLDVALTANAQ